MGWKIMDSNSIRVRGIVQTLVNYVDQNIPEKKEKTSALAGVSTSAMDPGGAKKFLYTGTKRQAEEEEQWSFGSKGQENNGKKTTGVPVDLNDVWSIQKNVSLGGTVGSRGSDRLTHNATKGFYSRHGGLKDGSNTSKPPEKTEGGTGWAPARVSSFSYSYAGNTAADDTSSIASSHVSRGYHSNPSPRRFDRQGPADENDF